MRKAWIFACMRYRVFKRTGNTAIVNAYAFPMNEESWRTLHLSGRSSRLASRRKPRILLVGAVKVIADVSIVKPRCWKCLCGRDFRLDRFLRWSQLLVVCWAPFCYVVGSCAVISAISNRLSKPTSVSFGTCPFENWFENFLKTNGDSDRPNGSTEICRVGPTTITESSCGNIGPLGRAVRHPPDP
jgi:hypothetical protein